MRQFLADLGLFVLYSFLTWLTFAVWLFFDCRRIEQDRLRLMGGEYDPWGRFRYELQNARQHPEAITILLFFGASVALYGAETIPGRIVLGLVFIAVSLYALRPKR